MNYLVIISFVDFLKKSADFLINLIVFIILLGLIVGIHEFGHFFFSRIFGVRVEKFYIFFDPKFELFKWFPKRYYGFFGKAKKLKGYKDE